MLPADLAAAYMGLEEIAGTEDNPFIVAWLNDLEKKAADATKDETPWCSAFINEIAKRCGLQHTNSAAARSWEDDGEYADGNVPKKIDIDQAQYGYDIVVFKRGTTKKYGHVGFYVGKASDKVLILGGNHGPKGKGRISITTKPGDDVIDVRRLSRVDAPDPVATDLVVNAHLPGWTRP